MKTRKWKKTLLTFVLIGALLGVQVMELVAYAAETGTDALEPSVVCSNYSQLYSAIIQAQDGDVIGIDNIIDIQGIGGTLGSDDKHVTIVKMNDGALIQVLTTNPFTFKNITLDGKGIDAYDSMVRVSFNTNFENVTIQNCKCVFDGSGGAMTILGGKVELTGCTFLNNTSQLGGHLYVMNDSQVTINGCIFEGGKGVKGGAINQSNGSPSFSSYIEINSSRIYGNTASESGGGIYGQGRMVIEDSKVFGNAAPLGEDITDTVYGNIQFQDDLDVLQQIFADENVTVNGWISNTDESNASIYRKFDYVVNTTSDSDAPGDNEDPSDNNSPGNEESDDSSNENQGGADAPSNPDDGEGDDQEDITQPGDSDQDSTEDPADPDAGDSDDSGQAGTEGGGNTDNSSNNGNTTNTTENSGNTTNTDNSSNDNTTVDNSSNDVVTDNSDHSSTDNSQTDNSQTTTDNSDHSTTTNTSDNSSHDTNTTTTNNSSDNSSKTTTTDNSQRSEDNSSVVTTYNYYQNPENQSQVQQGQQMQPIVVNNYIQPSQEGQQVEETDAPSNNIKIDAEGVDVVFEMVDGVYSISIKAANEPQAVQTVQDAVVPASNQSAEPASSVNWYEIIKIGLLAAILVNVLWKPRQNSPA